MKPLLLDTITEAAVEQTGLFRWRGIEAVIRDHLERRANLGYHLWGLLILFLWLKRWNIRGADSHETPNASAREGNRVLI